MYPALTEQDVSFKVDDQGQIFIEYWNPEFGQAPTLENLVTQNLAVAKTQGLLDIKELRKQGLDKAALSAGILAIYDANYGAAVDFLNGLPDQDTKNGMSAENYLAGFGARLNMTAIQFAQYIVDENLRVGPRAYEIEKRYLALTYGGDAGAGITPINFLTTVEAIDAAVENYRLFCGL
jgi:hypothetical protein